MFHEIMYIILIIGAILMDLSSGYKIIDHIYIKQDYMESYDNKTNDILSLLGDKNVKKIVLIASTILFAAEILVNFAILKLSYSFNNDWLIHVNITEFLTVTLLMFMDIFVFPIPGITKTKLSKNRVITYLLLAVINLALLITMLITSLSLIRH